MSDIEDRLIMWLCVIGILWILALGTWAIIKESGV